MSRTVSSIGLVVASLSCAAVDAATTVFFNNSQVATPVASGATWDEVKSNGYLFHYTLDKLFTGGIGPNPIGRPVLVSWPAGVEGQAVTAGPNPSGAQIVVKRVDGSVFDFTAFTAKLLLNTAATGASFEIMPKLNGEDAFNDPIYFDATGYSGSTFSYNDLPGYYSTALLKGYETYTVSLFGDFALTGLTLNGLPVAGPAGDFNANGVVDAADYVVWKAGLGGTFSQADYNTWRANFGAAAGGGAAVPSLTSLAAVPEPTFAVLFVMATYGATIQRWSRRGRNYPKQ